MPRPAADDDEDYDDDFGGGDDEAETEPCPHCGADVYEDAERCPGCGAYLSAEDRPPQPRSIFVAVGLVLALVAALIWVLGG
jgi:predicted nucleic acid-binding Zn ribbon protein